MLLLSVGLCKLAQNVSVGRLKVRRKTVKNRKDVLVLRGEVDHWTDASHQPLETDFEPPGIKFALVGPKA